MLCGLVVIIFGVDKMSRRYQTKNTDKNQKDIVGALRKIPGVSVEVDHDDIFIGYRKKNFWIEIKNPDQLTVDGRLKKAKGKTYEKQKALLDHWTGQYSICTTLDQILAIIGIQ